MVKVFTFYPIWNVKYTLDWYHAMVSTDRRHSPSYIFCSVMSVMTTYVLITAACNPLNDHHGAEYLEVFICIDLMPIIGCY